MAQSVVDKSESMMGKINKRYSLSVNEALEIYRTTSGIESIAVSFAYGYMQGMKATKKEIENQII